jgi:hypothetical protein
MTNATAVSAGPEFHHRDGWHFSRLSDGSVRMRLDPAANPTAGIAVEHIIPANEWPSIVAHVADGGSADAFTAAKHLHTAD